MVHIGHDTVVGKNCLFAAQVAIAGATTIEDEVILWGQVGVSKTLTIGKMQKCLLKVVFLLALKAEKNIGGRRLKMQC